MTDIVATYPATLHEHLNPSCELIQPLTLMQYKQYDALALAGSTDEIYSPELNKGDFVALSTAAPKEIAKSAKNSGFEVHLEPTEVSRLNGQPLTNGSSCPDSQQATLDAKDRRNQRRVDLQRRPHKPGPDILPPTFIQGVQPESVAIQKAQQSNGRPKVKVEGTVVVRVVIGIDGEVQNVRVLQSLNGQLDKKAVESVQQWKYSPARMKGLPVPAEIAVAVAFHLY